MENTMVATPVKEEAIFPDTNQNIPHLKTLAEVLNKQVKDGYDTDFKVTSMGLKSLQHEKVYQPETVHIVNFFRFEGFSDPEDNSILYMIETDDGVKGTLVDAYGAYADADVSKFIKQVEDISKKNNK